MGKTNIITVLTVTVLQIVLGFFWYSPDLFGGVMAAGGHGVDYLKLDALSVLLLVTSSFGLVYMFDSMIKATGSKDIAGGVKVGLTVGTFAIGLPVLTLLNVIGYDKIMLLVVFCHLLLLSVFSSIAIIKLKKI